MNKSELIAAVAKESKLTKTDSRKAVNAVFRNVIKTVARGERVELIGFGTFAKKNRKARDGRNPQTGEKMRIPAKKMPVFKPGKQFKEAVR